MANPNFIATMSSNEIWRDLDDTRCITDDLDAIEADILELEETKADEGHAHAEYAPASHEHSNYASSIHTHNYADLNGKPNIPTIPESLPANGGNADTLGGKAPSDFATSNHSHVEFSGTSASTYKLVYVAVNGNDNNDGFSTDAPMATVKGVIRKYAEKYKMLDIRLADGTYTEDIGTIAVDGCNLSIRSISQDPDKVIINMTNQIDISSVTLLRMYNMTLNVTVTGVRPISVNGGDLYAYGMRITVPEESTVSCVNVYNGCSAFLMNCILNSGTAAASGAAVYGNQAHSIKAINCSSERTVKVGFHAHNGTDIIYTDTITASTKTKVSSWGKCTLRT